VLKRSRRTLAALCYPRLRLLEVLRLQPGVIAHETLWSFDLAQDDKMLWLVTLALQLARQVREVEA
jgi:hypothetical protein